MSDFVGGESFSVIKIKKINRAALVGGNPFGDADDPIFRKFFYCFGERAFFRETDDEGVFHILNFELGCLYSSNIFLLRVEFVR